MAGNKARSGRGEEGMLWPGTRLEVGGEKKACYGREQG